MLTRGGLARRRSHSADFPVRKSGRSGLREIAVVRRLAAALGLIVVLAPAATLAQVNIDQDKSPAQLYAGDCAACHKSVRGLANGRSASALAGFLGEHYTASSREAAAIAAYVLASGGGAASPAPARAKPEGERTRANADEPRNREVRRPVQPEGKPPANAAARKPEPERRAAAEAGQPGSAHGPAAERHERGARMRGRNKPVEGVNPSPAPPAPEPGAASEAKTAVAAPPPAQAAAPAPQGSPASAELKAAAPGEPNEATPVPRDNIPD